MYHISACPTTHLSYITIGETVAQNVKCIHFDSVESPYQESLQVGNP